MDFSLNFDPLGFITGHSANQKMVELANADRDLQWRTLHEGMQWKVADLKAAGLNPMLAYSGGGASAGGTGGNKVQLPNPAAGSSTNFMTNSALAADIDLKKAQAENLRAQIPKFGAETGESESRTVVNKTQVDNILADTKFKMASAYQASANRDKLYAEVDEISAKIVNLAADTALKGEQIWTEQAKQIAEQASAYLSRASGLEKMGLLESLWSMATSEAYRQKLGLKAAENMADSEYSVWSQTFRPYLRDLEGIARATGTAWFLGRISGGR